MNGWTPERRARQAQLIHRWKPWEGAGVKTEAGKEVSKMNALKHGMRSKAMRQIQSLLSKHAEALRDLDDIL